MNLHDKAKAIKAVVMDVDGVLTDGGIGYGCGSDDEIKFFHVRDGLGIKLLNRNGIATAILSGRASKANRRRAEELGIPIIIESCHNKREGLLQICSQLGITPEECMYIGDDLIDLAPLHLAGIGVAVGDAVEEAKLCADWIMEHNGGKGAIREAATRLLTEKGLWDDIIGDYLNR